MTAWLSARLQAAIVSAFAISALAPTAGLAQIGSGGGPIDLNGDRTELLEDQQIWRWIGNVDVRQGDARLLADTMDIHYAAGDDGRPADILRIVALGSVSYITAEEIARADRGVYDADSGVIKLSGNLSVLRGDDVLVGGSLTYNPSTGRSVITAPPAGGDAAGGRVRAVFGQPTTTDDDDQ